jgi:hypothetical protein
VPKKTKEPKCTSVMLEGHPEVGVVFLDIAPAQRTITYKGERYFNTYQPSNHMGGSMAKREDGSWARCYLWEDWGKWYANASEEERRQMFQTGKVEPKPAAV